MSSSRRGQYHRTLVDHRTQIALVTGGGRGIGRAVALRLAAGGCQVCVNDPGTTLDGFNPDTTPANEVAAEIRDHGGVAMSSGRDARDPDTARSILQEIQEWAGFAPNILVHAAGSLRDGMIHKASDEDWAEVLGSHLSVAVEFTRAMAPGLRADGYGRVVYVGGAAGLLGSVGQAAYDVAKAGLFGLTRAVALEMAGRDVCINYVVPFAYTRMTESIPPVTEQLRNYLQWAPSSTPADVAHFIAWLCSPAASGISGQVFGLRGDEISIWSQPRPAASLVEEWRDAAAAALRVRGELSAYLTPLESEFDVFAVGPKPLTPEPAS